MIVNDNGVDREMTEAEKLAFAETQIELENSRQIQLAQIEARENAKKSARAKLAALGLSDDEINALVS